MRRGQVFDRLLLVLLVVGIAWEAGALSPDAGNITVMTALVAGSHTFLPRCRSKSEWPERARP